MGDHRAGESPPFRKAYCADGDFMKQLWRYDGKNLEHVHAEIPPASPKAPKIGSVSSILEQPTTNVVSVQQIEYYWTWIEIDIVL